MKIHSWREKSRIDWGTNLQDGQTLAPDKIQLGAILRIADATELMAQSYRTIISERDFYKRTYDQAERDIRNLERRVAALKGHNTRLKKARSTK